MKKISITMAVLSIFVIAFFSLNSPVNKANSSGFVLIRLLDEDGRVVVDETYEFEEGMTLFNVLNDNLDIACADRSYDIDYSCDYTSFNNHIILKIEDVETNWFGSYLQIFIGDEPSNYGIDSIEIVDGTVYTFKYVDLGGDGS